MKAVIEGSFDDFGIGCRRVRAKVTVRFAIIAVVNGRRVGVVDR